MNVLVVAAHPDDEVLGMGGTIRKYTKEDHKVKIMIMATGITSRRSSNFQNSTEYDIENDLKGEMAKQIKDLQKDAKKASKIMGVKELEFIGFPDNEMDKNSNLQITKIIERCIRDFKPEIVYTHSPYDINVDHKACYNATLTATRPKKNQRVKQVISFEVSSSTEWYFPTQFSPNIFIDISKEISIKIKALKAYKNEIKKFPHPRSIKAVEVISQRWGSVSGFNNAEAFSLVRQISEKI